MKPKKKLLPAMRNGRPAHESAPSRRRAGIGDWLTERRRPDMRLQEKRGLLARLFGRV
jgi:hypothetical protein